MIDCARLFLAFILSAFLLASCKDNGVTEPSGTPITLNDTLFVQGGTYQMGSANGNSDELPIHSVTLNGFYVLKTEVTQKIWRDVVQWAQVHGGTPLNPGPSFFKGDNLPVEQVSWDDVTLWLQHLNAMEGVAKYRLPTEAEWEYAARGGANSLGYPYSGSNTLGTVAWYLTNSANMTHFVANKHANELGLYDMSGNVMEWCSDWYGTYSATAQINPTGPARGLTRIYRGGSYADVDTICRVSYRGQNLSGSVVSDVGFRFVRDP